MRSHLQSMPLGTSCARFELSLCSSLTLHCFDSCQRCFRRLLKNAQYCCHFMGTFFKCMRYMSTHVDIIDSGTINTKFNCQKTCERQEGSGKGDHLAQRFCTSQRASVANDAKSTEAGLSLQG